MAGADLFTHNTNQGNDGTDFVEMPQLKNVFIQFRDVSLYHHADMHLAFPHSSQTFAQRTSTTTLL